MSDMDKNILLPALEQFVDTEEEFLIFYFTNQHDPRLLAGERVVITLRRTHKRPEPVLILDLEAVPI